MSKNPSTSEDQIVTSGEALNVVCKWLGVKSFDDALAADPHQQAASLDEELRPPLLGLGADPRKHRKALLTTSRLESRLGQRLRAQQHVQETSRKGSMVNVVSDGKGSARQVESESGDDEDESRAHAIKKRPAQPNLQTEGNKKNKKKSKNSKGGLGEAG